MKTTILTFLLIFTSLIYSFSKGPRSNPKLCDYPGLFERIADSLESSHSFKDYPIDTAYLLKSLHQLKKYPTELDSAMYAKGFVLSVDKIRGTNRILITSHHFISISEALTYASTLERKGWIIRPVSYKRDSLHYYVFGDKANIFTLTTNSNMHEINKRES